MSCAAKDVKMSALCSPVYGGAVAKRLRGRTPSTRTERAERAPFVRFADTSPASGGRKTFPAKSLIPNPKSLK